MMPFAATRMQLKIVGVREVSQKEKQVSCGNICMWNLRHTTNERISGTQTDSLDVENSFVVAKGVGLVGVVVEWEVGVSRY